MNQATTESGSEAACTDTLAGKSQIPSTKSQTNPNIQIQSSKLFCSLGFWSFDIVWYFGFSI